MDSNKRTLEEADDFEQKTMTRRAALKRIGITTGITALTLLKIDDIAHLVGRKLQEKQICDNLADELSTSGIAFADCLGDCNIQRLQCQAGCGCPVLCVDQDCNPSGNPFCVSYNGCMIACAEDERNCAASCS